jgi:hypothetical protein
MTFFRETEIDEIIAATGGVDVKLTSVGAPTVKGLVDIADESLLQGQAASFLGPVVEIQVRTTHLAVGGALAGLAEGINLVADGVTYRTMQVQQIKDGAVTLIHAARV